MTELLQLVAAGLALGARYGLVALGLAVVYRATGVLNLAQGAFVLLGAFLTYDAHRTWGLPFPVAVLFGMAATAAVGVVFGRFVAARLVGQPTFAVLMTTIGLLIVVTQVVSRVWGYSPLDLGDPWGLDRTTVGGVAILHKDAWTIVVALAAMATFFAFDRWAPLGVAMRAAAADAEAAAAVGIGPRRVVGLAWAMAAAIGALAGISLATGSAGVNLQISEVAFAALPAVVLGGLGSPIGAVVGGAMVGLAQVLAAGYQPRWAPGLGRGFDTVMPYLVMVAVLLVRPRGLFGQREGRRS